MKAETKLDFNMQKELNQKSKRINLIMLIIGAIGLLAYIVVGTILEKEVWWCEMLLIFAIPFTIGLIFIVVIKKQENAAKLYNKINIYEFETEFMNIETISNGEVISRLKFYYSDIVKVRETQNYIFLYIAGNQAFPILKNKLSNHNKDVLLNNIKVLNKK